ncbi:hypothetical protein FH972_010036 [Carpinus fangiana]|uniref:Thaumatin-like protein n=1 Tax=Carpinus fangiana TaxID=176857 RepID=A0A660KT65_9ROSI|nr:hypothetical protein FH972_010036 [Carpinus fangiana]
MVSTTLLFTTTFLVLCTLSTAHPGLMLTLVNKCPFTVWPAIHPDPGHSALKGIGSVLNTKTSVSVPAPTDFWAGQIWARTGCRNAHKQFSCTTGNCGGRLDCSRAATSTPVTLTRLNINRNGPNNISYYGVSLLHGFNVPVTVIPLIKGKGKCPTVGCSANLLQTCPEKLQLRSPKGHGPVVGCKSGCAAFGSDKLCCTNHHSTSQTCKPSSYLSSSRKHALRRLRIGMISHRPLMHDCLSPRKLQIFFCH